MTRVVFLCSGGGGNFRFVNRCIETGLLPGVEMAGLVTDRPCGALESAERAGVFSVQVAYSRTDNRHLLSVMGDLGPDVIVTTFDRILDPQAVTTLSGKLFNLHYSLLPAFAGTTGSTPIRLALERGCRVLGTTAHLVVAEVDSGPILAQSALPARTGEAFERTVERVFRSGAVNLAGALRRFGARREPSAEAAWSYRADVESFFSPAVEFAEGVFAETFWDLGP